MRNRALLLLAVVLVFALSVATTAAPARAQGDVTKLKYGEVGNGTIDNDKVEVQFKFTGKKNDMVAVQMRPIKDKDYKYVSPVIIVRDPKKKTVVDSSKIFGVFGGSALVVFQVKADGDYTILATRRDGQSGDSFGDFTIDLMKIETLEMGKEVTGTADSDGASHASALYAVDSKDDFSVSYTKTSGDFNPELSVYLLTDSGDLDRAAVASGKSSLAYGLAVEGSKSTYIISIDDTDGFFFQDEKKSSEFKLTVDKYTAP